MSFESFTGLKDVFGRSGISIRSRKAELERATPKSCPRLPDLETHVDEAANSASAQSRLVLETMECLSNKAKEALDEK
jgi:hypothetical protein